MAIHTGAAGTVLTTFGSFLQGSVAADARVIAFSQVASITDTLVVDNRVFTFANAAANDITLGDDAVAADAVSRLSSVNLSPVVRFTNPAVLLQLNAGVADDRVTVNTLDARSAAGGTFGATVLIRGETGNDAVNASASTNDLVMEGNEGDDWMVGGSGNDVIFGNAGNDTITSGIGNDVVLGDSGQIGRAHV